MKTSYSYSDDGENYHGDFDSPEQAAADGLDSYTVDDNAEIWVGENSPPDMACPIDADVILEALMETEDFNLEAANNFSPSKEKVSDLNYRLIVMWDSWVRENNIDPGFFKVDNSEKWTLESSPNGGDPIPVRVSKS